MVVVTPLTPQTSLKTPTLKIVHRKGRRKDFGLISKIAVLAGQILRHSKGDRTRSESMKLANLLVRSSPEQYCLVEFAKVKTGKMVKRVVMSDSYENYYENKGTGRKPKEGQVLFACAARFHVGAKNVIISTYYDNIKNFY